MDYRNLFAVSSDVCPEHIQEIFLKRISAILNKTDDTNLAIPVFLYFCQEGYVLYGVATLNKILSEQYCTDKSNSSVRGFVGVLTDMSTVREKGVPFSIDFYQSIYAHTVVPEWETYTSRCVENKQLLCNEILANEIVFGMDPRSINQDTSKCRLFSSTNNRKQLLSETIGANGDISIALNVENEDQVILSAYSPLTNAHLRVQIEGEYEDIEVKHRCHLCNNEYDKLYKENMCSACWDKMSQDLGQKINEDKDNTSGNGDEQQHPATNKPLICLGCGGTTEHLYTEFSLCDRCFASHVKKIKRKRWFVSAGVFVLAVLFLVWLFSQHGKRQQYELVNTPGQVDHFFQDSLTERCDTIKTTIK